MASVHVNPFHKCMCGSVWLKSSQTSTGDTADLFEASIGQEYKTGDKTVIFVNDNA